MKILILSLAAASAVALAPALAQPSAPQIHDRMDGTDRPSPVQTRGEVVGHVRVLFGRLDTNRDGFLTREEMQSGRAHRGTMMRQHRAHGTGHNAGRAFERLDVNRDGAISRAEWDARAAQRQQRRAALERSHDGVTTKRGLRVAGMGLRGRMFELADANRDNRLSFAEAQAAALQHFDRVDLNRDGRLTPDERRHMRQQRRSVHQRG